MGNGQNDRVVKLECELKSCQGQLFGFGKDLKKLLAEVNTIADWINERFGVNLIDKTRFLFEDIRGDCEEVNELTINISAGTKNSDSDSEIITTECISDKAIKHSAAICSDSDFNDIQLHNDVDVSFPGNCDINREMNTFKNRRGRPKKTHLQSISPRVRSTDASNQGSIPKRGRPRKEKQTPKNSVETPSKCDTCGKMLKDAGSLRQHQLIHKNIKPYPCPECGKCFRRKFHLKTHRLIHAGVKKHQCGYCGKLFLLPKDLIAHERTHTGEKPFSCTVCPKSFNLKSHLVMHIRTHTGEKPYRCDVCEKCFSQSNSLRVHKKVHQKPRNTTKSSSRQHRRPLKQEMGPTPIIYSIANSVPRPRQEHTNLSSNTVGASLLSPSQSSLSCSSAVNIPVSSLVTFEILPMSTSVGQHQHETPGSSLNTVHQNVKIEPSSLTVQDVLQLQPEISNTVEIMNINHVNIEQIIGHENSDNGQNEEQMRENIEQHSTSQNYMGNGVDGSYFY